MATQPKPRSRLVMMLIRSGIGAALISVITNHFEVEFHITLGFVSLWSLLMGAIHE